MKKTWIIVGLIFVLPLIMYSVLISKQPVGSESAIAAVGSTGMPKMIKFASPMCSDCQKMAEIIDEIDDNYKDKVEFIEIMVNQNSPTVREQIRKYNVKLVPTMVFLNSSGEQIARVEGSIPKEQFVEYIEQGLK